MRKFLSIEKVNKLEETIMFLQNYLPVEGEEHHIGSDIDTIDEVPTKLLKELGELNMRRNEILNKLKSLND